jgi:hypothetical protein
MKTPYDTAIKLQDRLVEEFRRDISAAFDRKDSLDTQTSAINTLLREELVTAASDPLLNSRAYASSQLARGRKLALERDDAAHDLEGLQDRAREALGLKVALCELARISRDSQQRGIDAVAQQALDEQTLRRRIR